MSSAFNRIFPSAGIYKLYENRRDSHRRRLLQSWNCWAYQLHRIFWQIEQGKYSVKISVLLGMKQIYRINSFDQVFEGLSL